MKDKINQLLKEVDILNNPYFKHLKDGSFTKEDFLETQMQFYFAVKFFNRPMTILASKIPTESLRLEVLHNVWEEHGEGDVKKMHVHTFMAFLRALGAIDDKVVQEQVLWPEVRIFNTCLVGACALDDYMTGVAMRGIIERMFCDISACIGQAVIDRGWFTKENIVHYNLHAELDIKHAQDFFTIVEGFYEASEEHRYHINQGLALGATVFYNLYRDLYLKRTRRQNRTFLGAHSRALGVQ